jgi:sulfite exporter TauE/SafE
LIALATGAFLTGMLGSLHCVGMCGPLALAVGGADQAGSGVRLASFVLGKTTTYVLLGAVAGLIGSGVGSGTTAAGVDLQAMVALVAGAIMVALGLENQGIGRASRGASGATTRAPGAVTTLFLHLLRRPRSHTPFFAGCLVSLLPCGLVYAMTARSMATGSILQGAGVMLAFGLGTAPALLATGWFAGRLSSRWRNLGERLASSAVVLMGLVAIYRGGSALWFAAPPCH